MKICLRLYSRDGSSYHLSNIIQCFLRHMHSTLNSQNIDIFSSPSVMFDLYMFPQCLLFSNPIPIENVILIKKYSCRIIRKALRHEKECQQHPVFPGGHPSKY